MLRSPRAWWVAAALGPLAWALTRMVSPAWIEQNYVQGVGQPIAETLGTVTGRFSFSVAQVGIVGLALVVLAGGIAGAVRPGRLARLRWVAPRALAVTSLGYATFVAIWGLDYHREPLLGTFGFPPGAPKVEEVRALLAELVTATNRSRARVPEGPDGVARTSGDFPDTALRALDVYARATARWSFLGGTYSPAKPVFASEFLSYAGMGGIYMPFTGEPNVNTNRLAFTWPFTVCHEMAHQRGVAREDEASFVAYVVSRDYGDPDFVYSATLTAASYVAVALQREDPEAASGLWSNLGLGTRRDLAARTKWAEKYTNPAQEVGSKVNHTYLRSNGVSDGEESYGRVVDLLVAERRARLAVPADP